MARVVHRRKSPPYALIIFAFLFLVSTALAVLTFNKLDKARQQIAEKDTLLTQLAGDARASGIGDVATRLLDMRKRDELKQPVITEPPRPRNSSTACARPRATRSATSLWWP